jgi:AraC-like DNA-binding protein
MDACFARPVPGNATALKLLRHYLEFLRADTLATSQETQELAVCHVYDLLAITLGASRDAAASARERGVGAALLCAIKADIKTNFMNGDLSVADFAARHRVTPRYIQILFEREGTTFTRFMRDQRIGVAHQMLANRRFDDRRIIDIALACGFSDLSFFNRVFRAHYGATPTDIRNLHATTRE